jgi:hypothetical protein
MKGRAGLPVSLPAALIVAPTTPAETRKALRLHRGLTQERLADGFATLAEAEVALWNLKSLEGLEP